MDFLVKIYPLCSLKFLHKYIHQEHPLPRWPKKKAYQKDILSHMVAYRLRFSYCNYLQRRLIAKSRSVQFIA